MAELGTCSICGGALPTKPWSLAVSRPDGKTILVRLCERSHVVIACAWVVEWIRSGRIDRK